MPRPVTLLLVGVLAVTVALLAACGHGDADAPDVRGEEIPAIPLDEDPGLAHVHGLGINPADGDLYVATHFGLWRVAGPGEAERVGEHYLDLMGFTVVGPDHFVASGHPPLTDELPPNLGLIETTDAGGSWRAVALLGSADFHALRHAHDRIYGWDTATRELLVSADGEDWDARGEEQLFDLAVDPDDPDGIVATRVTPGEAVTLRSDDGGRTWEEVATPSLARLTWEERGRLVAVGPDGTVWHAGGPDDHWDEVGDVGGFPEALLDADGTVYVAADHRIMVSEDDGASWDVLLDYR
jgi:hypothetical protein